MSEIAAEQKSKPNMKKELLTIGIPAVIESLITVVVTSIDTKMISPLGKKAVSAVSITGQPKMLFFCIFFALGTTVSIFVSHSLGRKDKDEANEYFHTVLRVTIFLSLVLGALLFIFADPVIRIFSKQKETIDLSVQFFRIIMGLMIFQTLSIVLNAALRGIGKTKVTLVSSICTGAVDLFVNYLIIEGHWGFPRLEVVGDALGTVAGTVVSCIVSIIFLTKHSDFLSLKGLFRKNKKYVDVNTNVRKKAGNVVFENLFTRLGFLVSGIVISTLPYEQTAVYFVAMILLNYSFAFGDGIQSTVVTLTGRSMGAKKYDDLKLYVKKSMMIAIIVSIALSAIYIFGAGPFYGSFFKDQESIMTGTKYSYVAAALTLLQITRIVNVAAMRGMGEVKAPRKMATLCVLIINPLCSYIFAITLNMDVWGVWLATTISQIAWCLMSFIIVRSCYKKLGKAEES